MSRSLWLVVGTCLTVGLGTGPILADGGGPVCGSALCAGLSCPQEPQQELAACADEYDDCPWILIDAQAFCDQDPPCTSMWRPHYVTCQWQESGGN